MKTKHIKTVLLLSLLPFVFSGCRKENALNLDVSRVESLYAPESGVGYDLDPAGEDVAFLWSAATAADEGLVVYEVVFDREDGNFSHPVYRVCSDDKGLKTSALITHKQLNKAAAAAGAGAGETVTLRWSVASSKGDGRMVSTESRLITVKRLNGFVDIPAQLFMSGAGAEADMQFTPQADGEFEIFTQLKGGEPFSFVSATSGTSQSYSMDGEILVADGTSTVSEDGVYRIVVDFNSAAVTCSRIEAFDLYFSPYGSPLGEFVYQGLGVWKATKVTVNLKEESYGLEERYKFRVTCEGGAELWYGSASLDNNPPTSTTAADYYNLYLLSTENIWDYTYKFNHDLNGQDVDITVRMQANAAYTHVITLAETEDEGEVQKELPARLYISGAGSEEGQEFRKISDGVFEIYTLLRARQNFSFVDALEGDEVKSYSIKNGAVVERGSTQVVTEAPYRIELDFNTERAVMTLISDVELFFPKTNRAMFEFKYRAQGEWVAEHVMIDLYDPEHDEYEDRYKFRFVVNGGFEEWFGSSKIDNIPPDADTPADYYYVYLLDDTELWNYTYKFDRNMHGVYVDMSLRMQGTNYTHEITHEYE